MKDMDEKLKKRIVDQLYWDSRVDVSTVNVDVTGRKVTITGTVPNFAASEVVLFTAWNTQGIVGVDNQLEVRYPDSLQPPPDKTIKERIEHLIHWNENLYGKEVELNVDSGIVELEGVVDSYWKKIKLRDLASHVFGVVKIVDKISVVPSRKSTDKAIAEKIMSCMERNDFIVADTIDVVVKNGIVTLKGDVSSWIIGQIVLNCAENTTGVIEINNEIIVDAPEADLGLLGNLARKVKEVTG